MSLSRREFMKICSATAAGLGVSQVLHPAVARAISGSLDGSRLPVLWVKGLSGGECTEALLGGSHPAISDLFLKLMSLEFHPALMAAEGATALEHMFKIARDYGGKYILVLEGAISQAAGGRFSLAGEAAGKSWTTLELVRKLAPQAAVAFALGSNAVDGGLASAPGSLTETVGLGGFLLAEKISTPLVNLPGSPPHPDWIVGTLAMTLELLASGGRAADLDAYLDEVRRPQQYYK